MSQAMTQYAIQTAPAYPQARKVTAKASRKAQKELSRALTPEDMELVEALNAVKSDMAYLHNCFDQVTDEVLVDALIFELKAAGLKYKYYHNLLKEKGIVYGEGP
jgi:hypothetical protein